MITKTQLITTWEEWVALSDQWNSLLMNSVHPSVFLTHEYLTNGWKHFHAEHSTPFILCIFDQQNKIIGIAPFRLLTIKSIFFTCRALKYICTWEMDKPYIITSANHEVTCWKNICRYLKQNKPLWDTLDLNEIATCFSAKNILSQEFSSTPYNIEISKGENGVWINLEKSWQELLRGHKNFNNKLNKLKKLPDGYHIIKYTKPDEIEQATEAYAAIEARSWKNAKIGISKDVNHMEFYKDTFIALAKNNNICIHLLMTGDETIAGDISYPFGDNVFFQHTTYDNKYRKISPGKLLVRLVIKKYLESNAKRGDFLCGFSSYLGSWGDGTIDTLAINIQRSSLKLFLFRISAKLFGNKYIA
jgi:hypothetical protein